MKKIATWMSPFLIVLLLMGCGAKKEDATNNNESSDIVPDEANEPADKENDRDIGEINEEVEENTTADNRVEVAEDAALKILDIGGVKSATVLVTNHHAYAAVNLGDDTAEDNSGDLEEKVTEKVKEADENIEKVYVSKDPDVANRLRDYANKIDAGEPIEGFFEEFNEAMKDIFPNSK